MSFSDTRYQRQMQLPRFGTAGQKRLSSARVLVVGCGALGTVVCEQLARAGIGTIVVVDRDLVERSNLQRQTLFTEQDARRAVPKAEAAKARIAAINASVVVRAFVDDLRPANARGYAQSCDLIVDCLDNFETRALLNDCAVDLRLPLVYGGAVGLTGMATALLAHDGGRGGDFGGCVRWSDARSTPCLRCLLPELPPPGEIATCETAGILGPVAGMVASIQAGLALRLLAEGAEHVPAQLVRFDFESLRFHNASLDGARDPACPCCVGRRFDYLAHRASSDGSRVLCGRNAVELQLGRGLTADEVARIEGRLRAAGESAGESAGETAGEPAGEVTADLHGATRVVKIAFRRGIEEGPEEGAGVEVGVEVGDGARSTTSISVLSSEAGTLAIVDGTRDVERARAMVARWIGV